MIIIVNRGMCPRRAIELIGHTSKDGETTVGRFGSGTAYAVALALRQNLVVTISSHDEDGPYEVQPYIREVTVGTGKARQVMWRYRRGSSLFKSWWESPIKALSRAWSVPTSFSVELGHKDWHGAFPVVREFVSNARDADPDGFACWVDGNEKVAPYGVTTLEEYLSSAKEAGHSAVTVVKIDNPGANPDAPEHYIENWKDNFRWASAHDKHLCGEMWRDGLASIYRKPELSPLKLFIRGVRCPWPNKDIPMSLYDYSLNIDLSEARTIKSESLAATVMTVLWLRAPREILVELLRKIPGHPDSWESSQCNDWVIGADGANNPVVTAWRDAHGDAPVSGPSDPKIPGAVMVAQPVRDLLARNGVPAAVDRCVSTPLFSGSPNVEVVIPSALDTAVISISIRDANRLAWILEQHVVEDGDPVTFAELKQSLAKIGAVPTPYAQSREPMVKQITIQDYAQRSWKASDEYIPF